MFESEPDRTAILVLGMHRSGTSATAGVLGRLGVELGSELLPPQPDNPKGFFEHAGIVALHDEVLGFFQTTWDDPRSLPVGWDHDPRLVPLRRRLKAILRESFSGAPLWGVKDPRLCRLIPFWIPVLQDLGVTPKALLVVRKPMEVSASLRRRGKMMPEQATMLWLSHVLTAERDSRNLPRTIVLYEDLLRDWTCEIRRIAGTLGVDLFAFSQELKDGVADFLEPELRIHRSSDAAALHAPQNKWADRVYSALVQWRNEGTSPTFLCDLTLRGLARAEAAAEPIAAYLYSQIRSVRSAHDAAMAAGTAHAARADRAEESARDAVARAERADANASDMTIQANQASMDSARAVARSVRAEATAAEAEATAEQLRQVLARTIDDYTHVVQERDTILASATWKATWIVRAAGSQLPTPVKRTIRSGIRILWRALTLNAPRKLREQRLHIREERKRT